MSIEELKSRGFESEFNITATRSSGPGGQHVNKVSTRIELRFNIGQSYLLSEYEKGILLGKSGNYVLGNGELLITAQEHRSQFRNKEEAINKFYEFVSTALTPKKKRKKTNPTKASIDRRIKKKKQLAQLKQNRRKPEL